jgi:hypothetical protein
VSVDEVVVESGVARAGRRVAQMGRRRMRRRPARVDENHLRAGAGQLSGDDGADEARSDHRDVAASSSYAATYAPHLP